MVKYYKFIKNTESDPHRLSKVIGAGLICILLAGILTFLLSKHSGSQDLQTDVLIYGTSLGGTSTSITLAQNGISSVLVGEDKTIGGQAVEAGLSAFDESRRAWENFGTYGDLKTFLSTKYNSKNKKGVGLGNAVVGSLATLPGDIQEFFQKEIDTYPGKIKLLQNYSLQEVEKINGVYTSAVLVNNITRQQLRVTFKYIVDGTQTGKVYEIAGTDYNLGFDKQEDTSELSALPETVRNYFINGVIDSKRKYGGFGNRTQAQSMVFSIYDKGYAGDFYQFVPEQSCWQGSSVPAYIKSGRVFKAENGQCGLQFTLQPEFSDLYTVYFINKGNSYIDLTIGGVVIKKNIDAAQQFINLGNYQTGNSGPLNISLTADTPNYNIEGVILVKAGNPATATPQNIELAYSTAVKKGKWFNSVTPLGVTTYNAKGESSLTWEFQATKDISYAAMFNWYPYIDRSASTEISIFDSTTNSLVAHTVFNQRLKSRNDLIPIAIFTAHAGVKYRIELKNKANLISFMRLTLSELDNKVNYQSLSKDQQSALQIPSGIYDLYARSRQSQQASLVFSDPASTQINKSLNNTTLALMGRYYVTSNLLLQSDSDVEILAVKTTNADTYSMTLSSLENKISLNSLPDGIYRAVITCADSCNLDALLMRDSANNNTENTFRIYSNDNKVYTSDKVYNDKSVQSYLSISGNYAGKVVATFYDDIPADYNTQLFAVDRPLLAATSAQATLYQQQTFFNYRNIISPENLLGMSWPNDSNWQVVGNNTLGLSLVSTAFNDYAPILTNQIESQNYVTAAKELSYAYYYWLKYDFPSADLASMGCDSTQAPTCDSRRINLNLNTFNTVDGFPIANYIREGRRLNSLQPIGENDLILNSAKCDNSGCSDCITGSISGNNCIAKEQSPTLFNDALAAVDYQLDFHSFMSREETLTGNLSDFLAYANNQNLLQGAGQVVFSKLPLTKPSEITLGSLIPKDFSNIFPGSTNIGVTQIASGYYRTHAIEMTIGNTTGNVLSYLIKYNLTPQELWQNKGQITELQKWLISKGITVFPLEDVPVQDALLNKAVQFMILKKYLKPEVRISGGSAGYYTNLAADFDAEDKLLAKQFFDTDTLAITNKTFIKQAFKMDSAASDDQVFELAKSQGIVDAGVDEKQFLADKLQKQVLYKCIFVLEYDSP